ncbi:hypothetical protein MLD38_040305 [Melastoma candidum]|uniref:Uncharacterized protein n=1 Tax=Melastoma candidum TaxID=119954 RepID=A0ACB9L4V1_9MYRT|nr:hypothetical protein MLD38_040305 [Melastoma candidum]
METKDSEDIVGVGGGEVSGNRRFPGEEGVGSCITRHEGVAEEKEAEGEIRGGLEKEGNRRGFREVDRSPSSPAADEAAVHLPKETGRCCRQESLPETHPTVAGAADLRKPCLVAVVVVPETSLDDPKSSGGSPSVLAYVPLLLGKESYAKSTFWGMSLLLYESIICILETPIVLGICQPLTKVLQFQSFCHRQ